MSTVLPHDALDLLVDPVRRPEARRHSWRALAQLLATAKPTTVQHSLRRHGLESMWLLALGPEHLAQMVPEPLRQNLQTSQRQALLRSLLHEQAVRELSAALEQASIEFVVFKGLQLACTIYDNPLERPAGDIDVLIHASQRAQAVRRLQALGFRALPVNPTNISHEMTLVGHSVNIDLHWHPVRPNRARTHLTRRLLAGRQRLPLTWGPNATDNLALLLIHTALSEHVTLRLLRSVDIDRAIRQGAANWGGVVDFLTAAGLRHAAWAMLVWTMQWFSSPVPSDVLAAVAPGRCKGSYIRQWLHADPAALYLRNPTLVSTAFSLSLHDRLRHIPRVLTQHITMKLQAQAEAKRATPG